MSDSRLLQSLDPAQPANRLSSGTSSILPEFKGDHKSRRKLELEEQIAALSAAADGKEESLRNDIDEVEVRLEAVTAGKRRTKQETRYVEDTLKHKRELLAGQIVRLQKQFDQLESAQTSIETELDSEHSEKLTSFKAALLPLEEAAQSILDEKERLQHNNEQFNERLLPLQESLLMIKEDIRGHIAASECALIRRRDFEGELNEFKEEYEEELADFLEEIETRDMLRSIRLRKAEQMEKVRKAEKRIEDNEKQLIEISHQLTKASKETAVASGRQSRSESRQEAGKLESYLVRKCLDMGLPELYDFVATANRKVGYVVEDVILREQLEHMDRKEVDLMQAWRDETALMDQELSTLQSRLSTDERALQSQKISGKPDPALEKSVKETKQKVIAMERTITDVRTKQKRKEDAMNRWRSSVRLSIGEMAPAREMPASDAEIQTAFAKMVSEHTADEAMQASVLNILQLYCQQLQDHSDKAGARDARARKRRTDIEDLSVKVQNAEFSRSGLASERASLQRELTKLMNTEKSVSKRFEQMKMKVEGAYKKSYDHLLAVEMEKRQGEMEQVFKTMGNKAFARLQEKIRTEVAATVAAEQKALRTRLEDKYGSYSQWDRLAHWHSEAIEDELKPQYQVTANTINNLKGEAERLRDQLRAIKEAEADLQIRTEAIVEKKKKELRLSLSYATKAHQAHVKSKRLDVLKAQLNAKSCKLDELDKEAEEVETLALAKVADILLEETQLKTRLNQLQSQLVEVGGDRQVIRGLERKLKVLDRERRDDTQAESLGWSRRALVVGEAVPGRGRIRTHSVPVPELDWEEEARAALAQAQQAGEEQEGEQLGAEERPEETGELKGEALQVEEAQGFTSEPESSKPAFTIRFSDCTRSEAEFFRVITPLLEGSLMYKKLPQKGAAKPPEFDLFEGLDPEACGYGLRELKLGKALTKLEIRQPSKPGVDLSVLISQLLEPIIPPLTLSAILAQKKLGADSVENRLEDLVAKYREMKEEGIVNYQAPVLLEMGRAVTNFPFVLPLTKGGRVELVARSYEEFKTWTEGIKALLKQSKALHRLKYKLD